MIPRGSEAVFSFCCVLVLLQLAFGREAPPSGEVPTLAFSAKPLKERYEKGEKVVLEVSIRNEGKRSVLLPPLSIIDEYLTLRLVAPDGKHLAPCRDRIDGGGLAGQKFLIVEPGASLRALVNLSCNRRRGEGYPLDQVGKFVVYAQYQLGLPEKGLKQIAGTAQVWTGRLAAPPAEFWITGSPKEGRSKAEGDASSSSQ